MPSSFHQRELNGARQNLIYYYIICHVNVLAEVTSCRDTIEKKALDLRLAPGKGAPGVFVKNRSMRDHRLV